MLTFVLGGGGSRGAFQVGALEVLAEADIKPEMVVGTSIGALNAAFFASDPTPSGFERLREIWLHISKKDIYPGTGGSALFHLLQGQPSLFKNDNLHALLQHYLPFEHFSDLMLPCFAIATDLDTGEIVAFGDRESDRLIDGLMSSSALVPAHPPWTVGERRFIDGGFGAVLPVRQAVARGATRIIALDLPGAAPARTQVQRALEISARTNEIMMRQQANVDLEVAAERADVTVINLESQAGISTADFSQTPERIEQGREIMRAVLADLSL